MAMLIPDHFQTIIPTEADVHLAFESSHRLAAYEFGRRTSARIHLGHDASAEPIVLPVSALRLLLSLLTEMSKGNSVTVIPTQSELTAQ